MKFCDPRTKFILIGNQKYIENKMWKSFYDLVEKSDYFDFPPSYETCCTTSLHEREKYCNIKNIKWLNNAQQYIKNNSTKSDKQDESIFQHIPEQNSIPVLFKPKIESDDTSIEENGKMISQQYRLYNLSYIKKYHSITKYQNINYFYMISIMKSLKQKEYTNI